MRFRFSLFVILALCTAVLFSAACGAGGTSNANNNPTPIAASSQAGTVFVIVMENKNYGDVVGSSAMPYFNSLIPQGALATRYYANAHPSIPNYFELTAGNPETLNDSFSGQIGDDNIARELITAGKTWKVYAENIPSVGYIGGDQMPYLRRHNPFSYFTDVTTNTSQAANMVPFTQLSSDIAAGTVPNFVFIVPNAFDDGHSCPSSANCTTTMELQQSDTWMSQVVPGILASSAFKNNGVLAVVWDEASDTDFTNGGGQVAALLLGPQVKVAYQSTTQYQHQDLLRMMCFRLGLPSGPGAAGGASTMSEFFK